MFFLCLLVCALKPLSTYEAVESEENCSIVLELPENAIHFDEKKVRKRNLFVSFFFFGLINSA